jgi:hypothetical protein
MGHLLMTVNGEAPIEKNKQTVKPVKKKRNTRGATPLLM